MLTSEAGRGGHLSLAGTEIKDNQSSGKLQMSNESINKKCDKVKPSWQERCMKA